MEFLEREVILTRFITGEWGTFGVLRLPGSTLFTVERPWADNQPSISCVPPGEYQLVEHHGMRYADTWALIGETVGHSKIDGKPRWACVFHAGNRVDDVKGCVAPGLGLNYDHERMVVHSRDAMAVLLEAIVEDRRLVIVDGV